MIKWTLGKINFHKREEGGGRGFIKKEYKPKIFHLIDHLFTLFFMTFFCMKNKSE